MIFCKIDNGNQTIIRVVPIQFYSTNLQTQQISILHKQFLQSLEYIAGDFLLKYYISYDENLFQNATLIIQQISLNGLQAKCYFSQFIDKQTIEYFQESYSNRKLIAFNNNKLEQIIFYKYNYFTSRYIFKFSQKINLVYGESFNIKLLKYQALQEQFQLISQVNQEISDNTIILPLPSKFYLDFDNKSIKNVTLNSFIDLQNSQYSSPLAVSAMLSEDNYSIDKPQQYVHFGSLQQRFTALANKYYYLYDTAKSHYYNETYSRVIASDILMSLDNFDRSQLYRAGLLKLNPETTSIVDLVSYTSSQFQSWLAVKQFTSSIFDKSNQHKLKNFLPQNISNDERNYDLLKFVNFMGNSFDQIWATIRNIARIHSLFETNLQSFTNQFLYILLNQYGINFHLSFGDQQLESMYLQYSTANNTKISVDEYNKYVVSRLLSNIHFLNRAKGTRCAIQQILNIFGLSSNLINVVQLHKQAQQFTNYYPVIKKFLNGHCQIEISSFSDNQFVISNFRIPDDYSSKVFAQINGESILYSDFNTQLDYLKQYSVAMYLNSDSQPIIGLYQSSQLLGLLTSSATFETITATFQQIKLNKIKYYTNLQFDSQYTIGNVFHGFQYIDTAIDFNISGSILHSGSMSISFDEQDINIQLFNQQQYSSIFNLGHSPKSFYSIDTSSDAFNTTSLSFQKMMLNTTQTASLFSNVFIGARSSNFFNNKFMFNLNQPLNNLLDNSIYDEYKDLNIYREQYENFFNVSNSYSYYEMVKLYEQLDKNIFKVIKLFIPYNINSHFGVMLDNHLLYRNKAKTMTFTESKAYRQNPNTRFDMNRSYNFKTIHHRNPLIKIDCDNIQKMSFSLKPQIKCKFQDISPAIKFNSFKNIQSNNVQLVEKNIFSSIIKDRNCYTSLKLINDALIIRQDPQNPLVVINKSQNRTIVYTSSCIYTPKYASIAQSYDVFKYTVPQEYKIIVKQNGLQITR